MLPIIFGSMRMKEKSFSFLDWIEYLKYISVKKIKWIHSSYEYDSFDLLCELLEKLRKDYNISFKHLVKLGEPHFNNKNFSQGRLIEKIELYRSKLKVDSLNAVQWMWRSDLNEDDKRILKFERMIPEINMSFQNLKLSGKVAKFYCFPYTLNFALKAKQSKLFDGYTVYRNYRENDYESFINSLPENSIIAIRPFFAGNGFGDGYDVSDMLKYNLQNKVIDKVVLTATEKQHLNSLLSFFD